MIMENEITSRGIRARLTDKGRAFGCLILLGKVEDRPGGGCVVHIPDFLDRRFVDGKASDWIARLWVWSLQKRVWIRKKLGMKLNED